MTDLIVVIPGIGGSVLRRGAAVLWNFGWSGFARALLRRGEPLEALRLPAPDVDDGVQADCLVDGVQVIPGLWSYGSYAPLTGRLRQRFGAANVVEFPYDWRRSNAASARSLEARVEGELRQRPAGTQVVLVAHSMGGIVARRYLACEGGAERCRMLVTIGTPYRGAVKALDALANGLRWVPGRTGRQLSRLLWSLPSVHELLPTYDCLVGPDDVRTGLAARPPAVLAGTALLEPAIAFHAETTAAVEALGAQPFDTIAVVGQRQATPTLARERDGQIELLPDDTWEGVTREGAGGTVYGAGDGRVPRGSAQPPEWGRHVRGAYPNSGRHLNLPQLPRVFVDIEAAIDGGRFLGLGAPERGGFGIDLPDVLVEGAPLVVHARHHSDRLGLTLTVTNCVSATPLPRRPFRNLGGGRYEAVVRALDPGIYEVAAEGIADGAPRRVSEVVTVFPKDETEPARR
ncbi:MAG: esterase/lipase family protein [Egibacteraceae bacterium]